MNCKFIGNCQTINWHALIEQIKDQEGDARTYGVDFYQNADGRFNEIINMWQTAGYDKSGTVEWINYYPVRHFDQEFITQFEKYTGTTCLRAWVSKINPGRYAPYHWDIDDYEEDYIKQGQLVRFTAHPVEPTLGQVLIVEEDVFHNQTIGNVYQWPNHRAWHAGGNCSFKPKYLFNFLGGKK
jgi:hypothetical protein